jgi:hypothetical protein
VGVKVRVGVEVGVEVLVSVKVGVEVTPVQDVKLSAGF